MSVRVFNSPDFSRALKMSQIYFRDIAEDLELVGLVWHPEIGDEVSDRKERESISVLVDTHGLTPRELRSIFLWLPTVEQIVKQFEARQAILCHTGLELAETALFYKTIVKAPFGEFESKAQSLRMSMGMALRELLASKRSIGGAGGPDQVH